MRLLSRVLAVLAMLVIAGPAAAQTYPKLTGFVVDAANVLPPDVEAALTVKLDALQKDTHRQLIVATIPDLQGYPIEDYAVGLGRAWGVGLSDVNNGIILFIAPNEPAGHRGPRIEVGRGLEPIVTDALAGEIIDEKMMPLLRSQQVPQAMVAGTDALIEQLRASPDEAKARTDAAVAAFDKARSRARSGGGGFPLGLVIWLVIIGFIVISSIRSARRGRRYRGGNAPVILWGPSFGSGGGSWDSGGSSWSGGGGSSWSSSDSGSSWGGGGFSGGGGGDFGGGGASGSW